MSTNIGPVLGFLTRVFIWRVFLVLLGVLPPLSAQPVVKSVQPLTRLGGLSRRSCSLDAGGWRPYVQDPAYSQARHEQ